MNAWLQTKAYEAWPKESAVHASTGPHGSVRTYINPELDASLKAGNAEHPQGAAAVKELYSNNALSGWAVMVKAQAGAGAGKGWYWYEVFSLTPGAKAVADANDTPGCANCHSAGKDSFRAPYPLQ